MKTLIVLPSYNERGRIVELIKFILNLSENYYLTVVDDSSPDETSKVVKSFIDSLAGADNKRINLIVRNKKSGRGSAVWAGFLWGLKSQEHFDIFVEMDCDFSHHPSELNIGINLLIDGAGLVVGSRYPDGRIINWPLSRRLFSYFANLLTRCLIRWDVHDYTNGYRFYRRSTVEHLSLQKMYFDGYINLSETMALALRSNFKVNSFPITFVNRKVGRSNTTLREMVSSFLAIFVISSRYWFGRRS